MKKLILILLIGFLCPAKGFSQADSVRIMQKINQIEQVTNETKELLKKAETMKKKKATMIERLKAYFARLKAENQAMENQLRYAQFQDQAVKQNNINGPVEEYTPPHGVDTIRGSFLYRLLHKNSFILRPYKIINDEKIYLD